MKLIDFFFFKYTGYSGYLDSLMNRTMANAFQRILPMNIPYLSPYPDLCAFLITLLLTLVLSIGKLKRSPRNIELVHQKKIGSRNIPIYYFSLQESKNPRASITFLPVSISVWLYLSVFLDFL